MSELNTFLAQRMRIDDVQPLDDESSPPWWEAGVSSEVDEETYYRYLEMLPPRYMHGSLFAFAEGANSFLLMWGVGRRYFAHQLSVDDTEQFCQLTGVSIYQ